MKSQIVYMKGQNTFGSKKNGTRKGDFLVNEINNKASSKASVLIVDDDATNILILKKILKPLSCRVVDARSGEEAIEYSSVEEFALIILDILMPGLNGYETLTKIKERGINKNTPVFFLTGMETDQNLLVMAYEIGAIDFIQKPINVNVFSRKIMYFLDYFDQKKELEIAKIEMEKLLDSRMSLIANITHELRTPLFAMLGMLDLLKKYSKSSSQEKLIEKIEINSENLLDTVNEFLDFSKTEFSYQSIESEYFNLKKMCDDILDIMNFQFHKKQNVTLRLTFDKSIPAFIKADKKKIRHILLNLFSNALKFTEHGHVKLEVKFAGSKNEKTTLKFLLEDTGVGIPEGKLKVIFDEYSQVENELQGKSIGTGLGLSICTKLVKVLGGDLLVKSEEKKGTEFSFSIPIELGKDGLLSDVKEAHSLDELLGESRVRILIADDTPDNLFVLKNYLNSSKITLELTHDSEEALCRMKTDTFDIVLLDICMPGKDGFEVAKLYTDFVKENSLKKAYLVALTAYNITADLREKLRSVGFSDELMKPVRKEFLYQKIVSIVHKLGENDEEVRISELLGEQIDKLTDFDSLDDDLLEYLPKYVSNKQLELAQIFKFVENNDHQGASSVCHKVLGTARSFGLFKVDEDISELQERLKEEASFDKASGLALIKSSLEHITELEFSLKDKNFLKKS